MRGPLLERLAVLGTRTVLDAACVGFLLWTVNVMPWWPVSAALLGFLGTLGIGLAFGARAVRVTLGSIVVTLALVLFTPIVNRVGASRAVRCVPEQAEAVVVLEGDRGHSRIVHGLRLWTDSVAPLLATPGADWHADGWRNALLAARFGVPADRLIRPSVEKSGTHYEALALRSAAPTLSRIVLVTSPMHSPRAALVFRRAGFAVCSSPADEPSLSSNVLDPWGRLLLARDVVYEALATLYYGSRGWI